MSYNRAQGAIHEFKFAPPAPLEGQVRSSPGRFWLFAFDPCSVWTGGLGESAKQVGLEQRVSQQSGDPLKGGNREPRTTRTYLIAEQNDR